MRTFTHLFAVLITVATPEALSAASLGTAITYQGVLTDGGAPVNGTVDLRFGLFADPTGGTPLETSTVDDLAVSEGRVTAVLDFGDEWEGNARWLEVEVREGASTGAYTVLAERQELLATPMGLYATDAEFATTADHASTTVVAATLDGHDGDFFRAFANLTGVPGGLSDGDDDTAAGLNCAAGEMPSWDGAAWICTPDAAVAFARTAVIGPVGDGSDPAANGAALLAAVSALPVPTSQSEAWRVEVEPGLYDLGTSPLYVPPWVSLQGAGELFTVLAAQICDPVEIASAAVVLYGRSELRDLTVTNTCLSHIEAGRAVLVAPGSPGVRLSHVEAEAVGGAPCTAVATFGGTTVLNRVVASTSACSGDTGAIAVNGADALLLDCQGSGEGSGSSHGLAIGGRTWVERGLFSGSSTTGADAAGIFVAANADIRNVITTGVWVGAYLTDQIVTLSRITNTGVIETSDQGGSLLLVIEHSRIFGAGDTVVGDTDTAIGIAMTQIYGSVSPSGGLIACAGVWDGSWKPYASTCP